MAKKTPVAVMEPRKQLTPTEQAWSDYEAAMEAIVDNYLIDEDAKLELRSAVEALTNKLEDIVKTDTRAEVEEEMEDRELTTEDVVDAFKTGDVDVSTVIGEIETDVLADKLRDSGWFVMACQSIAQKEKLLEFVKTEIYPYYNDQKTYLFE